MKKIFVLFFVLVSVVAFSACQPQVSPTPEESPVANTPIVKSSPTAKPDIATLQPTEDPTVLLRGTLPNDIVLDPALTVDPTVLDVCSQLYLGLVVLDADGNPGPGLATGWTISDDELDIVFTLRRDAAFSDGTPIDADVIVENFYRWFDPQHPLHGAGTYQGWKDNFLGFLRELDADGKPLAIVDGLEKVDNYTVLLHLNRRDPEMLSKLALPYFAILSPTALATGNYGTSLDTIVTNGPYTLTIWDATQLLLEPNPEFWGEQPDQKMKFDVQ